MPEAQFNDSSPAAASLIQNYLRTRQVNGREQRAYALKRQSLIESLKATGVAKPATILNFNPIALRMDGGYAIKIPSVIDPAVKEEERVALSYKGRSYRASVLTLREPFIFSQIVDVVQPNGQEMADGISKYEPRVCKQIEMAHALWVAYNRGTPSSAGVGGVVIFEGDRHALKRETIQVPTYITLPDRSREYLTESRSLSEVVGEALEAQQLYCEMQCQTAQVYFDDPDQRKNITPVHRIWGQYSLDMGFRSTAPDWLLRRANEPEETCEGCGEPRKKASAFFCHACARPYDPFACYMAGEIGINHGSLNRLKPEQWAEIHKEEARRKKLREGGSAKS